MLIKKDQRVQEIKEDNWEAWDYPVGEEVGIAFQKLNGRTPKIGWMINKVCREYIYVVKGSGRVNVDESVFNLKEGDVFIIEPTKKHFMEGEFEFLTITKPNWTKGQYKEVE